MFDAKSLLDQFLGGQGGQSGSRGRSGGSGDLMSQGKDFLSQQGGGLALGSLAGLMLGTRQAVKSARRPSHMEAWRWSQALPTRPIRDIRPTSRMRRARNIQSTKPIPLDAPRGTAFDPHQQPGGENQFAVNLLTAMNSAAKADGHIDRESRTGSLPRSMRRGLIAKPRRS